MTRPREPELSAILITPGGYASIRKAIGHLLAQDLRQWIEVIIVGPDRDQLKLIESELEGFHSWRVVEIGRIDGAGQAMALGVRAASAPVVVYVEEHSFPSAGWAEALLAAHRGPWAAVGPAVRNANPAAGASWAMLFLEFGAWVPPAVAGERSLLPSHQTSYKTAVLLAHDAELDLLLESETRLQAVLLAEGHRLYFEPAAQTEHVNVSRLSDVMLAAYQGYRLFAANRAAQGRWSRRRRALYVAGGPLLPLVRMYRTFGEVRRCGLLRPLWAKMFGPLVVASIAATIGEIVGYSLGPGNAARKRVTFELERFRYVTKTDRS
jgi:hypothetical protein